MKHRKEATENYNEYEDGKYKGRDHNPYYLLVKGSESGVIHPDTVEIGPWAFGKKKSLRRVIVPESVRQIGVAAFAECPDLEEVHLPEQLEEIPYRAFAECVKLHDINIPFALKLLCSDAFRNCVSLKQFHIPKETEIGAGAFYGCKQLADEDQLVIINGILMQDYRSLSDITIPEGVCEIDTRAYGDPGGEVYGHHKIRYDQLYNENREKIRTVTLPSTLKKLGNSVFAGCYNLENIKMNEGLESIGSNAFSGCIKLRSVDIPHSVKNVSVYAFACCKNLEKIVLHSGPERLLTCVFKRSNNIKKIIVPESWNRIPGFRRSLRSDKGKRESAEYKKAIQMEKDEIARILHFVKRTGKD